VFGAWKKNQCCTTAKPLLFSDLSATFFLWTNKKILHCYVADDVTQDLSPNKSSTNKQTIQPKQLSP